MFLCDLGMRRVMEKSRGCKKSGRSRKEDSSKFAIPRLRLQERVVSPFNRQQNSLSFVSALWSTPGITLSYCFYLSYGQRQRKIGASTSGQFVWKNTE